jgi:hypothetical protein
LLSLLFSQVVVLRREHADGIESPLIACYRSGVIPGVYAFLAIMIGRFEDIELYSSDSFQLLNHYRNLLGNDFELKLFRKLRDHVRMLLAQILNEVDEKIKKRSELRDETRMERTEKSEHNSEENEQDNFDENSSDDQKDQACVMNEDFGQLGEQLKELEMDLDEETGTTFGNYIDTLEHESETTDEDSEASEWDYDSDDYPGSEGSEAVMWLSSQLRVFLVANLIWEFLLQSQKPTKATEPVIEVSFAWPLVCASMLLLIYFYYLFIYLFMITIYSYFYLPFFVDFF